jgi:PAS domain S-box-containing protein
MDGSPNSRRSPADQAAGSRAHNSTEGAHGREQSEREEHQELLRARADLEHSRAQYAELFDFAPVPHFTFAADGTIESLNAAAAELLQIDRENARGAPAEPFFESKSRQDFRAHLDVVFRSPGKHAVDLVLGHEPGARHVHAVSRLIRGERGEPPLCLSAVIDITGRKKAEEEISRLNAALEQRVAQRTLELEESNRDMEAFIYSISHDLRAPLRNMAGFATIIATDYADQVPAEVRGMVKRIAAGNQKMLHLVDDLLRFSRLGRQPLAVSATDLNTLVDEALADLSSEMTGREIQWHRQVLPTADCDRGLMRQVFVNLLSNALKYSRPRRPAIIRIAPKERGGEPGIVIQDNGVGFDMRHADKLFAVFQRLHLPSEFEGSGVGLAMVARILQRHGGRAVGEGSVNQGATFWFTFNGLKK